MYDGECLHRLYYSGFSILVKRSGNLLGYGGEGGERRCALWLGGSVGAAILISAFVSIPALLSVADTPRSGERRAF